MHARRPRERAAGEAVASPVPRCSAHPGVAAHGWLAAHLPRYRALATEAWPGPLPAVKKLSPGDAHPGLATLTEILRDLGDLPSDGANAAPPAVSTYDGALVDAAKAFQSRTPSGGSPRSWCPRPSPSSS